MPRVIEDRKPAPVTGVRLVDDNGLNLIIADVRCDPRNGSGCLGLTYPNGCGNYVTLRIEDVGVFAMRALRMVEEANA